MEMRRSKDNVWIKTKEIKENRHLKSEWKRAQSEHTASDDHWRD